MSDRAQSRILVVEDEKNIGSTLVERLRREGFAVSWSTTKLDAFAEITRGAFDLALLDVGLPDGSGFEIAERIRSRHRATAVIFVTALGSPEDRVRGLELGAEDYVVKPFHLKELLLRIQNVLKRASAISSSGVTKAVIGRATVRFDRFEVEVDGVAISLTHKEASVLRLLYERRGQVVSRDEILNEAWSVDEYPSPRTVDNFILRLRKLVESDSENPTVIRSVRGVGYQLL